MYGGSCACTLNQCLSFLPGIASLPALFLDARRRPILEYLHASLGGVSFYFPRREDFSTFAEARRNTCMLVFVSKWSVERLGKD